MEIHMMSNKSQMNSSTCIFRPESLSLWGIADAEDTKLSRFVNATSALLSDGL
jgi:hypothetical protein